MTFMDAKENEIQFKKECFQLEFQFKEKQIERKFELKKQELELKRQEVIIKDRKI
jgi:hypothetical protein